MKKVKLKPSATRPVKLAPSKTRKVDASKAMKALGAELNEALIYPDTFIKSYSGESEKSKDFWSRINALQQPEKTELYACGVLLQNMEETVVKWLNNAEFKMFRQKTCSHSWEGAGDGTEFCLLCPATADHFGVYLEGKKQ